MLMSEKTDLILSALYAAQKEMPVIKKSGYNPFHKSRYALLGDVIEAIKQVFVRHELMVSQFPSYEGSTVIVETVIFHVPSGQYLGCRSATPATENAQGTGSAITYLRRYGLVCMAFLDQEDDDGESASGRQPEKKTKADTPVKDKEVRDEGIDLDTYGSLLKLVELKGISQETVDKWFDHFKVTSLQDLSQKQALKLINQLKGK